MKTPILFYIALLLIPCLFPSNRSLAQDYTQWHLPESAKARLGKGKINDIKFSPDGSRFAVATTIGIWIYDARTGEELALLTGHEREVKAVAFSLDGRTFTSVDAGGKTCLWDTATTKLRSVLTASTDLVEKVALSSDSTRLVTVNIDDTFRLWHLDDRDQGPIVINDTEQRVLALALSPDGRILASSKLERENQTKNFRLQVWDTTTQDILFNLTGDTGQIHTVAFSPDGRTLVGLDTSGKTHLWDVSTGASQRIKKTEVWTQTSTFSPDGKYLATGDMDGKVRLWDITTKAQQSTPHQVFKGHRQSVSTLAFSPDRKMLLAASRSGIIQAWDTDTGNQRFTIIEHIGSMLHLTFSETDSVVTSINSPDSVWIGDHFQYRQWDVRTGNQLFTHFLELDGAKKISPDGKTILADPLDGTLDLWDIHRRHTRSTLNGHLKNALNVLFVFSLDGKMLASVGKDRVIRVWKNKQSTWRRFFSGLPLGRSFFGSNPQFTFKGHTTDWSGGMAFSPDGKILAHARTLPTTTNTTLHLYSTEKGETLFTFKTSTSGVTTLAFSPDGKTLAGGNQEAIYLWDTSTGARLGVCTPERLASSMTLVFSPDSKILVSVAGGTVVKFPTGTVRHAGGGWITETTSIYGGGVIQLWDARTGKLLSSHTGHTDHVKTLAFSKDEKTLASGSADGTILLWDWEKISQIDDK